MYHTIGAEGGIEPDLVDGIQQAAVVRVQCSQARGDGIITNARECLLSSQKLRIRLARTATSPVVQMTFVVHHRHEYGMALADASGGLIIKW